MPQEKTPNWLTKQSESVNNFDLKETSYVILVTKFAKVIFMPAKNFLLINEVILCIETRASGQEYFKDICFSGRRL